MVLDSWVATDDVAACQEAFDEIFAHRWATGVAPDEVNYTAGVTPPDHTRQMCNGWKASPVIARIVLAQRTAALRGLARGARRDEDPPGQLHLEATAGQGPRRPSGLRVPRLRSIRPNMTTCWTALDDTHADTGTIYYVRGSHRWPATDQPARFHAPDDWLAHVGSTHPPVSTSRISWCRWRCRRGALRSTRVGRSTAARRTSARIGSGAPWSPTWAGRVPRHHLTNRDPVYSRYLRPGSTELDEAFFPILWRTDGYRTAWLP